MRLERTIERRKRNRMIIFMLIFVFTLPIYYAYSNIDFFINTYVYSNDLKQYNLIIGDISFFTQIIFEGDEIYLPLDKIQEYIYPYITLSEDERYGLLELKDKNFTFTNETIDAYVKTSSVTLSFLTKKIDTAIYFPVKSTEFLLGAQINHVVEKDILLINTTNDEFLVGQAVKDTYLLENTQLFPKRITTIGSNSHLKIYEVLDKHYRVVTENGDIGYVNKSSINLNTETETISKSASFNQASTSWSAPQQIGLVWDYIKFSNHDRREQPKLDSLDILSPTWFRMVNEDGTILNSGSMTYANDARSKGYKIWGLVTNSFDPELTSKFLADEESQDNFIRQILIYSAFYNLDGINIDFENIFYKDKDAFTEFVARLTDKLHEQNLVVSIDITVPSSSPNWSMVYDRKRLGEIVDYVAIMTYDEHWGSSPKSGSVASIGWVERGIQRTLESIPAEKILLGLPFYTRLWEEERLPNGKTKVSSKAYGMNKIMEILVENNAEILWDQTAGQYYSQFKKEGKTYRVWLEEERSLSLKASLIEKYNLAGFAAWRKDFEKEDVWIALYDIVKNGTDYNLLVFEDRK